MLGGWERSRECTSTERKVGALDSPSAAAEHDGGAAGEKEQEGELHCVVFGCCYTTTNSSSARSSNHGSPSEPFGRSRTG